MKLICNRDGCTEPATHQGYIGNPPVIVALCKVHAIENAIKRQQEGAAEPAPINYDNFTIASTTDGLVLWYDGDSFTLDSEMERQLIDYLKPKYNEALIQQGKCISCQDKDCDVWITADQTCWKSSKEHDAAIASAAIQQDREKAKIGQCENCWSNGRRECMYHGYPQDTIPRFCGYKLGMDLPAPKDRQDITVGMVYAYEAGLKEADDKVQQDRTRIRNAVSALSTGDFTMLDVLAIIEGEKHD